MADECRQAEAAASDAERGTDAMPAAIPLPPVVPPEVTPPDPTELPFRIALPEGESRTGGLSRYYVPWMLSAVVHQGALILLALWIVSGIAGGGGSAASLFASFTEETEPLETESILATEVSLDEDIWNTPMLDSAALVEPESAVTTEVIFEDVQTAVEFDTLGMLLNVDDLMTEGRGHAAPPEIDTTRLREATSVEGATGGVVGDMLGELAQGDLLVVWLFDQSISLVDDRQRVAVKLAELFEQTSAQAADSGHVFKNVAAAFGGGVRQLVPPTESTERIVKAVGEVPTDDSGREMVFSAVAWAADKYARHWNQRMLIVVWTDESGDDLRLLESTVATCRRKNVSVSVVGPSAILGRQEGTHSWVHQPTGRVFQLGVMRGPDSALPERLLLPYWWPTRSPEGGGNSWFGRRGGWHGNNLPPWYGGEQLEGMASGMGPYGLTRLALETGGTYTIFDRSLDRGPFRLETMRPYAPDYRAAEVAAAELRYRPLPRAVLHSVDLLSRQSPAMQPANDYFGHGYQAPLQFRTQLKNALTMNSRQAAKNLKTVEIALGVFGAGGMEAEYAEEPSPRYQAWYDLTRGRLLAVGVRCMEFIQMCELVTRNLDATTNRVVFAPSHELRSGSTARLWAEEAARLLRRCTADHAETPWAYLAQRELDYPFGVDIRQTVISKPPPRPITPARPRGRPSGGGTAIQLPKL